MNNGNDAGLYSALQAVNARNDTLHVGSFSFEQLMHSIAITILNPLIELLFAAALIVFLIGIVQYIRNADNEKERTIGARRILWGLIGMLVMISAMAIVQMLTNTV